jgi:hypothetical protein
MANIVMNKTNGKELTKYKPEKILKRKSFESEEAYAEYIERVERNTDYKALMFFDNIQAAKNGKIVICQNWEQVEEIMECFDNNEDWLYEKFKDCFYVLTSKPESNQRTAQLNKFKAFKESALKSEIVDLEN